MHIDPADTLSQTLIRKWFWQGAALLQNKQGAAFGADGMLVLQGAAGVGKTSFFRYAAMKAEWFVEGGRLSEYDKDFQRRCLTSWITEFGELERSVTSQTANTFKALVTNAFDAYRLTYDRQDTEAPRRTNFGATCNSTEFIPDDGVSVAAGQFPSNSRCSLTHCGHFLGGQWFGNRHTPTHTEGHARIPLDCGRTQTA